MTAIVLPDLDQASLDRLRRLLPSLSEIELPSIELPSIELPSIELPSIDRLLGRSRRPVWPWVAFGLVVIAILGSVAAWATWTRRPSWTRRGEPWAADASATREPVMDVEIAAGEASFAPGERFDDLAR